MKKEREKGYANVRKLQSRVHRGGALAGHPGTSREPVNAASMEMASYREDYIGWLEGRGMKPETLSHRRGDLETFLSWAHERGLSDPAEVTLAILENYQRHMRRYRKKNGKPLSNTTQRQRLSVVREYFRWLVRQGLLPANPASELMLPRKELRLPEEALSLSQVGELMNQPDTGDALGIRDRAMLELLYATGIRRSELARLALEDLNRENETLRVRMGKGDKDRIVPVGARALSWCERYLEEVRPLLEIRRGAGVCFLTGYGEGFHPNSLGYVIRKYLRAAGIGKGGSHLIRHTCATHLLEGGADIRYIQQLLGHACLDTTSVYTRVSIESLKRVHQSCHPAEVSWRKRIKGE